MERDVHRELSAGYYFPAVFRRSAGVASLCTNRRAAPSRNRLRVLAELARTQWFHPRSRCAPSRLVGHHARIRMERYTFKLEPANELGRTSVPRPRLALSGAVIISLTLIGSGLTRRDLFLRSGDLAAPAQPEPILPIRRPIPWTQFGPILLIVFGVVLPLFLYFSLQPDLSLAGKMWRFLPWGLATAVLNAANEEFQFRCVPLARLKHLLPDREMVLADGVLFRSRALLRATIGADGCRARRNRRLVLGQEHDRNTRLGLGVRHPPGAGHRHLRLFGDDTICLTSNPASGRKGFDRRSSPIVVAGRDPEER